MDPTSHDRYSLSLDDEERRELLRAIERSVEETRYEAERTDQLEYRQKVRHSVDVLRNVLSRLRDAPQPSPA